MRHFKSVFLMALVSYAIIFSVASAQEQRALVETASPDWQSFTCVKNGDGTIECAGCVIVTDTDGDSRPECAKTFKLTATVNQNRANGLGDAVRNRALRRFGVDGGAP